MDLPVLLLSGAIAGTLAGLLGIGGGVIIVPIVTLLFEGHGVPHAIAIKMALGTSLATIVVTAMSSIYTHHRKGAVEWRLFHVMGPAVFVGSLIGAWLADIIPGDALYIAFIVFLFAISIQMAMSRVGAHRSLPGKAGLAATSATVWTRSFRPNCWACSRICAALPASDRWPIRAFRRARSRRR